MIHAADFTQMIHAADFKQRDKNSDILRSIREKITYFEDKLIKLKEATTALELALWKMRMNEKETSHPTKKFKIDETIFRRQCRVNCGGDIVIRQILPFLISM